MLSAEAASKPSSSLHY